MIVMCYFDRLYYDELWCNYHTIQAIIIYIKNKNKKGHYLGVGAAIIHEYNLIFPQIKQVGLFIYIKGLLFFPLRPQYHPNILACLRILDFCLFLLQKEAKVAILTLC